MQTLLTFDPTQRLVLSSDHAGAEAKNALAAYLREHGYDQQVLYGAEHASDRKDYPLCAAEAVSDLLRHRHGAGIFICGSGIGISIAANRFPGIRAALCHDMTSVRLAREHNDANILCLGARLSSQDELNECTLSFLTTAFDGGRHAERVEQIDHLF